jgi:hypothetical protein
VEFPFRSPELKDLPGLLCSQPLGALTELLFLDQSEGSVRHALQARGAARMASMPVGLDRTINALLSQRHARPAGELLHA